MSGTGGKRSRWISRSLDLRGARDHPPRGKLQHPPSERKQFGPGVDCAITRAPDVEASDFPDHPAGTTLLEDAELDDQPGLVRLAREQDIVAAGTHSPL